MRERERDEREMRSQARYPSPSFLQPASFPPQVEVGRENYTTIARLLSSGAMTAESLRLLESFFAPHNAQLHAMFGGRTFW